MSEQLTIDSVTEAAPTASIMDRTVCLSVNKSKFGNRRKAALALVETKADKELLSLSKRLIESPELKAVSAIDAEIMHYLRAMCMPSMFKTGVYLLPLPLVERVEDAMIVFRARRGFLVDEFITAYPKQIEEISARLSDQFDASNYPDAATMRASFAFEWQYVTFGVPGSLQAIKRSLFEDEKAKYADKLREAADEYRQTLRVRLLGFFEALAESLTPTADGKKRKLYESTVKHLEQALELFELQDATDDAELAAIVAQGRAIMAGQTVETLRDDENARARVEQELATALASLKTLTVDRSTRAIELDDEAAAS